MIYGQGVLISCLKELNSRVIIAIWLVNQDSFLLIGLRFALSSLPQFSLVFAIVSNVQAKAEDLRNLYETTSFDYRMDTSSFFLNQPEFSQKKVSFFFRPNSENYHWTLIAYRVFALQ